MKIKVRSFRTLFVIFLTSPVICKHGLLHGNEIVQYLQNYKCYNVDQHHFINLNKVLQDSRIETTFKRPVKDSNTVQS